MNINLNIYIRKFEKDYRGDNLEYKFLNAYPVSINTMPLSYDASQLLISTSLVMCEL